MADVKLNFTGDKINELLSRMDNGQIVGSGIFELVITDIEYDNLLNSSSNPVPLNSLNNLNMAELSKHGIHVKIKNHIFTVFGFDGEQLLLSNSYSSFEGNNRIMDIQRLSLRLINGQMQGQLQKERIAFASVDEVLTKHNTSDYHPTSDYNPATKKYVDDKINSGSSNNGSVSSNKIVLGKYIIRYDDEKGSLEFAYTDEEIINVTYEAGGFNNITGAEQASSSAIRCTESIKVDTEFSYIITFEKDVNNFAYCLFDSANNFISCSSKTNVEKGNSIKLNIANNATFVRFEFSAPTGIQADAFDLIDYIDIGKSISEVLTTTYEAGEFYDDGTEEPNTITIRNVGYIPIEKDYNYAISFPGEVRYFRYHFYDTSYNFLTRSESMDILTAKTIAIDNNDEKNAYLRFKFGAVDDDQSHAFEIAKQIEIKKIAK